MGMSVYVYVNVYVYVYVYESGWVEWVNVCVCVYVYVCFGFCHSVYVFVCVCMSMYVCVCGCMCVYGLWVIVYVGMWDGVGVYEVVGGCLVLDVSLSVCVSEFGYGVCQRMVYRKVGCEGMSVSVCPGAIVV